MNIHYIMNVMHMQFKEEAARTARRPRLSAAYE